MTTSPISLRPLARGGYNVQRDGRWIGTRIDAQGRHRVGAYLTPAEQAEVNELLNPATYPECHWCAGTYRPISEAGSEAAGEPICEACAATLDCDAFDS